MDMIVQNIEGHMPEVVASERLLEKERGLSRQVKEWLPTKSEEGLG